MPAFETHHRKGTTVHVNIEPTIPGDKKTAFMKIDKFLATKVLWSIVSLFVPELALLVALYERRTAVILRKEVQRVFCERASRLLADNKDKSGGEKDQVLQYLCTLTLQQPPNTPPPSPFERGERR